MSIPPEMMPQPGQGLGMAVNAPQTGIVPGPPVDEADLQQRMAGWRQYFQHPEGRAALMQLGVQLGQPRSVLQSEWGHSLQAVAGGAEAAGRAQTAREKLEKEEQERELVRERTDVAREGVAVQREGVGVQRENAATARGQLEETTRGSMANERIQTGRLNIEADRADTEADRLEIARGELDLARTKENNEAGVRAAQARYQNALGSYYETLAKNPLGAGGRGSAEVAKIQAYEQAILAANPGMDPAQAKGMAIARASEVGAQPRSTRIENVLKELRANARPGTSEDDLLQQAIRTVEAVDRASSDPLLGAAPAPMPSDPMATLPPEIQQQAAPVIQQGGQFLGQEMRTGPGGIQIPVYKFQDANGQVGYLMARPQ